jgi:hypothetical protein
MSTKITQIVEKTLDYATIALLTLFMGLFALGTLVALFCTFYEGDLFNLVGVLAGSVITWGIWSVWRELV